MVLMSDAIQGLNPAQREAVLALDGPCLVLAGAGSGKTRVISRKIIYLVRDCGYDARRVVALTFTNKAAREMALRVRQGLDARLARGLTVSTFHSLGLRILRAEAEKAGLKPAFSILDAGDCREMIRELLNTTDKQRVSRVQQRISLWKNALVGPGLALQQATDTDEQEAAQVYDRYHHTLLAYQAVDFDDLIRLPAVLLEEDPQLAARWQDRVHYLLVDEYQDTNHGQYRLMRALTGPQARFTAVGDDDQAIYAWRGATVENLVQLTRDYPSLRLIKLEQNYRSVGRVLQAANRLIACNPQAFGKTLWSELGEGEALTVTPMDSDVAEAETIAARLSAARFDRQAQWRDFAVLYRSNHQARVLEQALRALHIPYTVSGGQSFFDKTEVRDMLAWLRLMANEEDDPAFIRAVTAPRRGIGQASLETLGQLAGREGLSLFQAVSHPQSASLLAARPHRILQDFIGFVTDLRQRRDEGVLDDLLAGTAYQAWLEDTLDELPARRRWENVLELMAWLKRKAREDAMGIAELVQHVALVSMLERSEDDDPDAVRLSTLHAAKGLEYPHVFLVGVEEGFLPHHGNAEDDAPEMALHIQEERRLMYVGITRAQRSLHISWCRRRRRAREERMCEASRFIAEMGLQAQARDGVDVTSPEMSPRARLDRLKSLLAKSPG